MQTAARARRKPKTKPFRLPVDLHPKQWEFVRLHERPELADCEVLTAMYGGSAGSGKSWALLGAALQFVHVPGYAALLLRRRYGDLEMPGGLVPTSREWIGDKARFNRDRMQWTFPSGATISFGYLDHDRDLDRYQGAQLSFVAFDELTQFPENHYRYLFSRLRKPESLDVPLRMYAASNPGGIGHEWVKRYFLEEGESKGRVFVPALLQDNPSLDRERYVASMANLDPLTRERLLNGDWDAVPEGGMFKRDWFPTIEREQLPRGLDWYRFWDLAATAPEPGKDPDYTAGVLIAQDDGVWYVRDVQRFRLSAQGVEKRIRRQAELDGRKVAVRMEQEPGSSGKSVIDYYARRVLPGFDFKGVRSTGSKTDRSAPVASAAEAGNVILVSGGAWITDFLDELAAFPQVTHDDQVDALSGGFECALYQPFVFRAFRVVDL